MSALAKEIALAAQVQHEIQERRNLVEHPGFQRGMEWLCASVDSAESYAVTPDYRAIVFGSAGRTELNILETLTALQEGHRIYFSKG